jgi:hypothetical protein
MPKIVKSIKIGGIFAKDKNKALNGFISLFCISLISSIAAEVVALDNVNKSITMEWMNDERIEEKIELRVAEEVADEQTAVEEVVGRTVDVQADEGKRTDPPATANPNNVRLFGAGILLFVWVIASAGALTLPVIMGIMVQRAFPHAPLYAYILGVLGLLLSSVQDTLNEGGLVAQLINHPEQTSFVFLPTTIAAIHLARNRNLSSPKKMWWSCVLGLGFLGVVPPAVAAYFLTQVKTMSNLTKVLAVLSLPFIGFILLRPPMLFLPAQFVAAMPVLQVIGPGVIFGCFVSCIRDAFNQQES